MCGPLNCCTYLIIGIIIIIIMHLDRVLAAPPRPAPQVNRYRYIVSKTARPGQARPAPGGPVFTLWCAPQVHMYIYVSYVCTYVPTLAGRRCCNSGTYISTTVEYRDQTKKKKKEKKKKRKKSSSLVAQPEN